MQHACHPPNVSDGCDFKHTLHVFMLLSPGENVRRGYVPWCTGHACLTPVHVQALSGIRLWLSRHKRMENPESAHWRERRQSWTHTCRPCNAPWAARQRHGATEYVYRCETERGPAVTPAGTACAAQMWKLIFVEKRLRCSGLQEQARTCSHLLNWKTTNVPNKVQS